MGTRVVTKLENLIDPEVMADMISAKVPNKMVVAPFAKVDDTLVNNEGDTITVPQYKYIGSAIDVAEGVECDTTQMEVGSTHAKVKKAMKAVEITDEAVLSAHGDPVAEATNQLAKSVAEKTDIDTLACITDPDVVQLQHRETSNKIKYSVIVDAIDLFGEEVQSDKVMFVNPAQVTTLRKDSDFISADKYDNDVMMKGEIGRIAGTRIVPSRRVVKNPLIPAKYALLTEEPDDWSTNYTNYFTKSGDTYTPVPAGESAPEFAEDTYYKKVLDELSEGTCYMNPIVKLNNDADSEEDAPAMTIYLKKDTNVEQERNTLARKTIISVDKHYCVALSNTTKVVLAFIKA